MSCPVLLVWKLKEMVLVVPAWSGARYDRTQFPDADKDALTWQDKELRHTVHDGVV